MSATVTHLHPTTLNPGRVINAGNLTRHNLNRRIKFTHKTTLGNVYLDGPLDYFGHSNTQTVIALHNGPRVTVGAEAKVIVE